MTSVLPGPAPAATPVAPRTGTRRHEARRPELPVEVQEDCLAALPAQVAALPQPAEQAAESAVEDRLVPTRLLSDRKRERVGAGLPRKGDLDRRHGARWYRCSRDAGA